MSEALVAQLHAVLAAADADEAALRRTAADAAAARAAQQQALCQLHALAAAAAAQEQERQALEARLEKIEAAAASDVARLQAGLDALLRELNAERARRRNLEQERSQESQCGAAQLARFGAALHRAVQEQEHAEQLEEAREQQGEQEALRGGDATCASPAGRGSSPWSSYLGTAEGGGERSWDSEPLVLRPAASTPASQLALVEESSGQGVMPVLVPSGSHSTRSESAATPPLQPTSADEATRAALEQRLRELQRARDTEAAAAREGLQLLVARCASMAEEGEQALAAARERERKLEADLAAAAARARAAMHDGEAQLRRARGEAAAKLAAAQQDWEQREQQLQAGRQALEAAARTAVGVLEGRVARLEAQLQASGRRGSSVMDARLQASHNQDQREALWRVVVCNYVARVARWRQRWLLHACLLAWRCGVALRRRALVLNTCAPSGAAAGAAVPPAPLQPALHTPPSTAVGSVAQSIALRSPFGNGAGDAPRPCLSVRPSPARHLGCRPAAATASLPAGPRVAHSQPPASQPDAVLWRARSTSGTGATSTRWTTASTETAAEALAAMQPPACLPACPELGAPVERRPSAQQLGELKASLLQVLGSTRHSLDSIPAAAFGAAAAISPSAQPAPAAPPAQGIQSQAMVRRAPKGAKKQMLTGEVLVICSDMSAPSACCPCSPILPVQAAVARRPGCPAASM